MKAVAVPTLVSNRGAKKTELEGNCGYFVREIDWQVNNPQQGVIIQEITRTPIIYDLNADPKRKAPLSAKQIDAYIKEPGSSTNMKGQLHYWELWKVDAIGTVGSAKDGTTDTFGLCAIHPVNKAPTNAELQDTSAGSYQMVGVASFYVTKQNPSHFGFARKNVTAAGDLFSSSIAPVNLPAASGAAITHTVKVEWDSSKKGPNKEWGETAVTTDTIV